MLSAFPSQYALIVKEGGSYRHRRPRQEEHRQDSNRAHGGTVAHCRFGDLARTAGDFEIRLPDGEGDGLVALDDEVEYLKIRIKAY